MTWNVLCHEYTKNNTSTGYRETKTEKQRRWMQSLTRLQILQPDIGCLQEVTPDFVKYLVGNYKEEKQCFSDVYEYFYAKRTYPKTGETKADGCLTLIRKEKFSVKGVNPIHLKNLLSDNDPRVALAVYIQPKSQLDQKTKTKDILILNVHLDSKNYPIRQKQIAEAVERALLVGSDIPFPSHLIVCGDFNEKKKNIQNMCEILKTYSLKRVILGGDTSNYGAIDHIFTNLPKKNLGKIQIYSGGNKEKDGSLIPPPYKDDSFPSDHYIVVKELLF